MDREDSIECVSYRDHVATQRQSGAGVATGRRVHDPIEITKRIDRSTPLLFKALVQNEEIEGEFRFYRPAPTGDGSTEHFLTVEFRQGRITDIQREIQLTLDRSAEALPALEKVSILFGVVNVRYESTGVGHEDDWTQV